MRPSVGVARLVQLLPILALYGGRVGVAAVGILVLPLFNARLSPAAFGWSATLLSLQSLAVLLDLGLSAALSREIAVSCDAPSRRALVATAERAVGRVYVLVLGLGCVAALLGQSSLGMASVSLIVISLGSIVWQNLLLVALIGQKRFISSAFAQLMGLGLRHGLSLLLITLYESSFTAFAMGQAVGGVIAAVATKLVFLAANRGKFEWKDAPSIPLVSLTLGIYTVAGAAAMQLDKPILSLVASPAATGQYFLASTIALVPITFLAGPIAQFAQPRIISALHQNDPVTGRRWIARLTAGILLFSALPSVILWLALGPVVGLWLGDSPTAPDVLRFAQILMPGAAVGAFGYAPAIVLIARRDFRFLAAASAVLAASVLAAAAAFGAAGEVAGICYAYAAYHTAVTLVLWWRAWHIEPSFAGGKLALRQPDANAGSPAAEPATAADGPSSDR